MKIIKHSIVFLSFFSVLIIIGNVANAVDEGTVAATVSAKNIAISVSDASIAYGSVTIGSTSNTAAGDKDDTQSASNAGNVIEDFNIKGQNSGNWTLSASAGSEIYAHGVCITSCDGTPAWGALSTSYSVLDTSIAVGSTKSFDLQVSTPTATGMYTAQSVDIMVQAVEN